MATNAANAIDEEVSIDSFACPDRARYAKRVFRLGFLAGTSMPGRRSIPARSIEVNLDVELNGCDVHDQARRNAPADLNLSIWHEPL
jgi:hypothetical protein